MSRLTVTSWGNPAEGMGDCFHLQCQAEGWDRIGCTVYMDGSRTLLDSVAPPRLVFWWLSNQCTLWDLEVFCCLESEAWSLTILSAGHSRQCFPSFLAAVSHEDVTMDWTRGNDCFSTVLFPNSRSKVPSLLDFPRPVWPCHRDSGIGLGTFPLLGLLEFCQLAYLQYWVLCLTHPRLAASQSVSLCVFHGFVEWIVGISDGTEIRFNFLYFLCGLQWWEV